MTEEQPWIPGYLAALRQCGVRAEAARVVGVAYAKVLRMGKDNGDFAEAENEALEEAYDVLEAEMLHRATVGVLEPVVYQGAISYEPERDEAGHPIMEAYATGATTPGGEPVMAERMKMKLDMLTGQPIPVGVRKKSDALLMFALKGRRKAYSTQQHELTGANGGPQQITVKWADD
jgi:hypothetical protein